ncbi:Methyltransferase domain-containing protein [Lachnospiraceae bacterium NE2001]|nr:Methyltransferase domain-containing protein [Lachnospiraceae bacterium NE2001]
MKKGDIVEGIIDKYSFPNKGSFLHVEENPSVEGGSIERRITVKGALPGQRVKARIKKKKEGYADAILMDVVEKSPQETKKPMCDHFYSCGGCTYQTFAYTSQLKLKEKMVKDLLAPVIDFESDFNWEGILASPDQFRYRNKMEFTFGDSEKDGPLTLGLHRRNSTHDIISIDSCALVSPAWNEILKFTQKFYRDRGVPHYNKRTHTGVLRNLVIRESATNGGILVNLVTTTHHSIDEYTREIPWNEKRSETVDELCLPEYVAGLLSLGDTSPVGMDGYSSHGYDNNTGRYGMHSNKVVRDKNGVFKNAYLSDEEKGGSGEFESLSRYNRIVGVLYTECDTLADAIIPDTVTLLYGEDYLMEEVLGLKFKISPYSFFQTNTRGSEVLYSRVRDYANEAIALSAAKEEPEGSDKESSADNAEKTGVIYDLYSGTGTIAQMMSPVASKVYGIEIIEEAVEAARENAKLNKLANCEFIAGDVLKKLDELEEKPDLIILDPPRDGVNPKALQKILSYGVDSLVYISCKPTSLARDLEIFEANGYAPVKGCCIDQFPNTQHVEVVSLLQRLSNTSKKTITLDVDMED